VWIVCVNGFVIEFVELQKFRLRCHAGYIGVVGLFRIPVAIGGYLVYEFFCSSICHLLLDVSRYFGVY
jgi:hypothetical protein